MVIGAVPFSVEAAATTTARCTSESSMIGYVGDMIAFVILLFGASMSKAQRGWGAKVAIVTASSMSCRVGGLIDLGRFAAGAEEEDKRGALSASTTPTKEGSIVARLGILQMRPVLIHRADVTVFVSIFEMFPPCPLAQRCPIIIAIGKRFAPGTESQGQSKSSQGKKKGTEKYSPKKGLTLHAS